MVLKRFFTENLTGGVIAGIGNGRNEKIDARKPEQVDGEASEKEKTGKSMPRSRIRRWNGHRKRQK